MILDALLFAALLLGAVPASLYLWNAVLFRRAPCREHASARHVSVLIPARNEEASIEACIRAVLASRDVELEVIVLDDHSADRTAEIVQDIADSRVRLESAPLLPTGWNGKQHACFVLSKRAKHPLLCFLDADVRLEPDALARMAQFQEDSGGGLVSGFPRQETETLLEKLLLPLINWVLLSYLPMIGMRWARWPMFAAGCGQFFFCTRDAYAKCGGHAAIRDSMHDGVTMPRAFRRAGIHTDLCDATDLAACRMYRTNLAVWDGLAKNAHEGLGSAKSIVPWTILLLGSLFIPLWILPRIHGAIRFRQSLLSALLHPVGIVLLVAIQWYALIRRAIGRPVVWKGRSRAAPRSPLGRGYADQTSNSSTIA